MKKDYENIELEVIRFTSEDVIVTSPCTYDTGCLTDEECTGDGIS